MALEPSESTVITMLIATLPIFITAYILYLIRAVKGPTIADTVLAIDAFFFDVTVFVAVLGLIFKQPIMMVVAIVFALWAYALDVYVAKYLERGEMGD